VGFKEKFTMMPPKNSPEPPPIADSIPHSRLTDWAARLSFCRWPMTTRVIIVAAFWFALVLSEVGAQAQAGYRMIMHTFQQDSNVVFVAVADSPSGPRGIVTSPDSAQKKRYFTVTNAEFEKMWSTLMSSEVDKYTGESKPNRTFDAMTNYVFSAGYGGKGKNYAVPTIKASPPIVALATQLRAYAK
jgi:hypothetical protein